MDKNYRIYSDSDAASKNNMNDKKDVRDLYDRPQNAYTYQASGSKDAMTSNKIHSMY